SSSTSPATCSACSTPSAAAVPSDKCSVRARTGPVPTGRLSSRRSYPPGATRNAPPEAPPTVLTRDPARFLALARDCAPDFGPATARAAFMVAPDGFGLAGESASDNRYMADAGGFDAVLASAQHRGLQRALSDVLPTLCFPGDPDAPDALF